MRRFLVTDNPINWVCKPEGDGQAALRPSSLQLAKVELDGIFQSEIQRIAD